MRENRTVPFRDTSIKVSRNYYGHQYICMADVCEIIKQRELLKDGAILNLCPSAMKMTFRRNGRDATERQTPSRRSRTHFPRRVSYMKGFRA